MATKKVGKKSAAANDFLEPKPPINVGGTNVGTNRPFNNGAVSVSFELPAGSPPATSYTVTASTGQTATGASSPIVVTGIASAATPTFTVTATNASGTSAASSASSAVTVTTVPGTPTGVSASATSANTNTISWTAPANGGSAITSYTITGSDGSSYTGISGSASSYAANDPGVSPGSQTYTIVAINANGTGAGATTGSVTTTRAGLKIRSLYLYPGCNIFETVVSLTSLDVS